MQISLATMIAILGVLAPATRALVLPFQANGDLIRVFEEEGPADTVEHSSKDEPLHPHANGAASPLLAPGSANPQSVESHDSDSVLSPLRSALEKLVHAVSPRVAPLLGGDNVNVIPHRYIVVMQDEATPEQTTEHHAWVEEQHAAAVASADANDPFFFHAKRETASSSAILDTFGVAGRLQGYFGYFMPLAIKAIRANPLVKYVEADSVVHANNFNTQSGAPWGLARVSHRDTLGLSLFNKYLFDDQGGKGVTSYVIDTGINIRHVDFGGRATWGKTVPAGDEDEDGNGHGTHCAGTIAGKTYGIAKNANVVAIKVLRSNGSGSMSDVVKGVDVAVTMHRAAVKKNAKGFKGSTANMSLGGGKSPTLDMAVNAAVNAGIHFAVAAGNENQDACNLSPARAANAVTVAALTIGDARAYFSNFGTCVDIFGPGMNVLLTYIGLDTATAVLLGTSMAAPHIAGLLSYYVSLQPGLDSEFFSALSGVTPAQLKRQMVAYGTRNVLSDVSADTPNVLAFNGAGRTKELFSAYPGEAPDSGKARDAEAAKFTLHGKQAKHFMGPKPAAWNKQAGREHSHHNNNNNNNNNNNKLDSNTQMEIAVQEPALEAALVGFTQRIQEVIKSLF